MIYHDRRVYDVVVTIVSEGTFPNTGTSSIVVNTGIV